MPSTREKAATHGCRAAMAVAEPSHAAIASGSCRGWSLQCLARIRAQTEPVIHRRAPATITADRQGLACANRFAHACGTRPAASSRRRCGSRYDAMAFPARGQGAAGCARKRKAGCAGLSALGRVQTQGQGVLQENGAACASAPLGTPGLVAAPAARCGRRCNRHGAFAVGVADA